MWVDSCRLHTILATVAVLIIVTIPSITRKPFTFSDRMGNLGRQKVTDVPNKEAQDEASTTKSNRDPVWPPIRQRESLLRSCQDDWE
jgi:hypothetical protein